jgi:hypothetical protein
MPKLRHLAEPPEWRRVAKPNILLHTPDQFVTLRRQTPIRNRSEAHLQEELEGSTIQTHRTARTTSTSNTSLESLDSDSWFQISSYVPKSTILAICCTSRHLHDTLIPILYHSIDLSIHSTTAGTRFSFHYRRQMCRGQYIFLRQILRKPEYGQYVRSFMWTLGLEDEKVSFLPRFMEDRACRDGIWLSEQSNTSRSWECDQEKPLRAEHGRRGSLSNCSAYSSGKCGILSISSSGSKFYSFPLFFPEFKTYLMILLL